MRARIIAVGTRMPNWVRAGFEDYRARLTDSLKLALIEIEPGPRSASRSPQQAIELESQRLSRALRKDDYIVALDERGTELTTRELSTWLGARLQDGRDIAFLIGGPDGLAPELIARSDFKWALSRLTFPHALARVVLAEQLYRAHSVLTHHPYHRD